MTLIDFNCFHLYDYTKDDTMQSVNLHITPGLTLAQVTQTESQSTDINEWFIVDNQKRDSNINEQYAFGEQKNPKIPTSWYMKQKLCEINGNYGVQAFIHYYPNGKVLGEFPIIIEYLYNY